MQTLILYLQGPGDLQGLAHHLLGRELEPPDLKVDRGTHLLELNPRKAGSRLFQLNMVHTKVDLQKTKGGREGVSTTVAQAKRKHTFPS